MGLFRRIKPLTVINSVSTTLSRICRHSVMPYGTLLKLKSRRTLSFCFMPESLVVVKAVDASVSGILEFIHCQPCFLNLDCAPPVVSSKPKARIPIF